MSNLDLSTHSLAGHVPGIIRSSQNDSVALNCIPKGEKHEQRTLKRRMGERAWLLSSDVAGETTSAALDRTKPRGLNELGGSEDWKETSCDDQRSLDVMKRFLEEVHQLKRQRSSKHQERINQIRKGGECPSIPWFRNNHRPFQGSIVKRSVSVGCVVAKPSTSAAQTRTELEAKPLALNKSSLIPSICSQQKPMETWKARGKRRLARCLSTPVMASGQKKTKKQTKQGIARSKTASVRTIGPDQEGPYFDWKDWVSQKQKQSIPGTDVAQVRTSENNRTANYALPRRASMSCLVPTPECSTLIHSFDWDNHSRSTRLPDVAASPSSSLEVFDWKEWAKSRGDDDERTLQARDIVP